MSERLYNFKRWYNRNEPNVYAGVMLAIVLTVCIMTILGVDGCEVSHTIRESFQGVGE